MDLIDLGLGPGPIIKSMPKLLFRNLKSDPKTTLFSVQTLIFLSFIVYSLPGLALRAGLLLDSENPDVTMNNQILRSFVSQGSSGLNIVLSVRKKETPWDLALNKLAQDLVKASSKDPYVFLVVSGHPEEGSIKSVLHKFPRLRLILIDQEFKDPHTRCLFFDDQEAAYLAGILASEIVSSKFGFIGMADVPTVRRTEMGFRAGIQVSGQSSILQSQFLDPLEVLKSDPQKVKTMATKLYQSGHQIILADAGPLNSQILDSATENHKPVIFANLGSAAELPKGVLAGIKINLPTVLGQIMSKKQKWTSGINHFGLKNKGVEFLFDSQAVPAKIQSKIKDIQMKIYSKKVKVPDFLKPNS